MVIDLTPGAISKLLTGEHTVREPVVQVIDIKCLHTHTEVNSNGVAKKKARYSIVLSDGSVCIDGFITIFDVKISEMISSNKLQKGSLVQLTKFSSITDNLSSYISVRDLNVIRCNCIILGDPKPFPDNKTPSVNEPITPKSEEGHVFITPKSEEDHVFITPKSEEDHVDPDVNDDRHHAHKPSKQKCSPCSQTQSRKRQRQSSNDKEDDEIGACFEKLEKLGWGEGPMYDTAVLLFGESSDYRKIWLHLKPKSCVNWVKNAGSKYGLLG